MRKILFILSLLIFINSCSYFRENYRETSYTVESGERISLIMYEMKEFFGEKRTLYAYGNDYNLKGRKCDDAELKKFSKELWAEIARQNNLAEIKSGIINLLRRQSESTPEYCNFIYSKNENGEWE